MAKPISWVKSPRQARSEDTLGRMLDAAEALLDRAPWEEITVAALVKEARSSIGAFYARFADKDALLQHLHQRHTVEAVRTADEVLAVERWRGVPLPEALRALATFAAAEYRDHAGFHREVVRRNSVDSRFRARSATVAAHVTRLIASLLDDHEREHARAADTLRAAEVLHRALFSMLDQHVQFVERPPGALKLSHDELIDEVVQLLLGYLRLPVVVARDGRSEREGVAR